MGVLLAIMGFGLVWHIWWLVALCLLGAVGTFIVRSCNDDTEYWVPVEEIERIENRARLRVAAAH